MDRSEAQQRGTAGSGVVTARRYAVLGVLLVVAHVGGLLGPLEALTFVLLGPGFLAAIVIGVRRHRPDHLWPWVLLAGSVLAFMAGGTLRVLADNLGDLSAERALVPDIVTLFGYVLMVAALLGMLRSRDRAGHAAVDAFLDALVLALCALALGWVLVIEPALAGRDVPLQVHLILAAYPATSVFVAAIAGKLAMVCGGRRMVAARLLFAACSLILVGDVLYMFAEMFPSAVSLRLIDLPYLLTYVAGATAVLHPSMRGLTVEAPRRGARSATARLLLVLGALLVPGTLAVTSDVSALPDRLVLGVCVVLLAAAVSVRLWRSVRAHAHAVVHLEIQAVHDELTGLPNRAYVDRHLPLALDRAHRSGTSTGVLFLDLDRFKVVNDSLGHATGDLLLIAVANRLGQQVREGDIVARIGGDEFVVLLEDLADVDAAVEVAERILAGFDQPFLIGQTELHSATSVGIAVADGDQAGDLLRNADAAMYQAKAAGRGTFALFDLSMVERAARQLRIEAQLRGAADRQELSMVYQPQVAVDDGRLVGVEALLRWTHPQLGAVSPAEFIPVAEETGLIASVGAWVLEDVGEQMARWRDTGSPLAGVQVAVNVSTRQLTSPAFASLVRAVLARYRLAGSQLCVEMTESAFIDDPGTVTTTLQQLRQLGVQIDVDDFGTGFSSLAYLQRYAVDQVKIDRTFVHGVENDVTGAALEGPQHRPLVAPIVAMAQALGLTTLAEGVETVEQLQRLRELGCDRAQGYLFSHPLSPTELAAATSSPHAFRPQSVYGSPVRHAATV